MSLFGQFSVIGNITFINTFQPQQTDKKKRTVLSKIIPVDVGRNQSFWSGDDATLKKNNFHVQNEIKISSADLASAMRCQWLMQKSSQNPPKNLFQLSRNYPTLWPKEAFLPSSSQPTNPQHSLSLMFSLVFPKNQQWNRMQACRLFWIAPTKRTDGEMERSFRSPKVEEC